tara:strand:- start:581 stop:781 length:201 start_codon:yes stop_codon:yes gene_type:complete
MLKVGQKVKVVPPNQRSHAADGKIGEIIQISNITHDFFEEEKNLFNIIVQIERISYCFNKNWLEAL